MDQLYTTSIIMVGNCSIMEVAFNIFYYFFNVAKCGGTYPQYVALDIASPNYPSNYPYDASCLWTIPFIKHQEIVLTISDVHLENGYDILTIHSAGGVHRLTGMSWLQLRKVTCIMDSRIHYL